ncbi:MAG TPA: hypothetical protein PK513_04670 [Alphaproteobacteria bacterium]|nr:hypothetical protein [Alphaproteobacteria bacterium]
MPEIFSTGAKFKLVEYGSNQQGLVSIAYVKDKLVELLQRIAQK